MPQARNKWSSKLAVILAITVLFCFMLTGMSFANVDSLKIYPDVVKADRAGQFTLEANFDGIDPSNFYDDEFYVTIEGFDLSANAGKTLFVEADVNYRTIPMNLVPEAAVGDTVTFVIPSADMAKDGKLTKLVIHDLNATSPCQPGEYDVTLQHEKELLMTLYRNVRVVDTITDVEITSVEAPINNSGEYKAGQTVNVAGLVTANCGDPWPYTSWKVYVAVYDLKGRLATEPVEFECPTHTEDGQPRGKQIDPVIAHTSYNEGAEITTFAGTIQLPAYAYKNRGEWTSEYVIKAWVEEDVLPDFVERVGGYEDVISDPYAVAIIPDEPRSININGPDPMKLNAMQEITIGFKDKYCNPATAIKDELVALASYQMTEEEYSLFLEGKFNEDYQLAGIFYSDPAGKNEISKVTVPDGQTEVTVYFRPILGGDIVVAARIENLTSEMSQIKRDAFFPKVLINDTPPINEISGIVLCDNGNARSGWPLKGAYWVSPGLGATKDYDVYFEIIGPNGDYYTDLNGNAMYDIGEEWGTWDTELNLCYKATGRYMGHNICQPWDTITHEFCTDKVDYFVYPNPKLVNALIGQTLEVKVNVVGVGSATDSISFVSPVELIRELKKDTWQIVSTPKYLVKPAVNGVCQEGYGTFGDLFPKGTIDALALYDNGRWNVVVGPAAYSVVPEPLKSYYVRTHQKYAPGDSEYFDVNYVFDVARNPSAQVPPTRTLGLGWNNIGASIVDRNVGLLPNSDGDWDCKHYQSEFLYRYIGTLIDEARLVYNPKLGNLGKFGTVAVSGGSAESWALDPVTVVFNGDGYWVYMNTSAELGANVGLEPVNY